MIVFNIKNMVDVPKTFVKETSDGLNAAITHTGAQKAIDAMCTEGADRSGKALQCLTKFTPDKGKQEQLKENTIDKGKTNAKELLTALRDAAHVENKTVEIYALSGLLGIDVKEYMDPGSNIDKAVSKINEDGLYNAAYYGVDAQIARWNGTPSSPTNEQDAGAAVAANEEQK